MTKLYNKSPLIFSLVWIAVYVILASVADSVSVQIGITKIVTAPLLAVMSAVIYIWIAKSSLKTEFGLCKGEGKIKDFLFYLPLLVLITVNLWNGFALNMPPIDTVLYIISMLCVGFLEEVIFRGFLFKALSKNGLKSAFVISSLTFGIGHVVNLLNGAELLSTSLQIISAVLIGFLFTLIFYKSGSLIPCIITHGVFNSLSAFGVEGDATVRIITCLAICVICVLYSLYILKYCAKKGPNSNEKEKMDK